jgi:hypothetical protein
MISSAPIAVIFVNAILDQERGPTDFFKAFPQTLISRVYLWNERESNFRHGAMWVESDGHHITIFEDPSINSPHQLSAASALLTPPTKIGRLTEKPEWPSFWCRTSDNGESKGAAILVR